MKHHKERDVNALTDMGHYKYASLSLVNKRADKPIAGQVRVRQVEPNPEDAGKKGGVSGVTCRERNKRNLLCGNKVPPRDTEEIRNELI